MRARRVVLAGFYPPPFAGEPVHVRQLAACLRDRGFTVEVLNLNRHARPSPEYASATGRLALLWKLFTSSDRRAVLHLHTNGHGRKSWLLILVASLAARLRRTTTILTLHSGLLPAYVGRFGTIRRGLARWVLRGFDRVICVNEEIRDAIERVGITADRTVVVPAFLGVTEPPDLTASDRELVRPFRPLVVAVAGGEHDPERGLAVVLDAVTRLREGFPGLGLVLMGWQVGPKTAPLIQTLGLTGRAICLGEVPHERCLALVRSASVFVRSTFSDGDAITVREALALGVPVVASDTSFRPDGTILFRKGDAADLASKLADVLGGQTPRPPLSRASHDQPAAALWQLYSHLAGLEAAAAALPPPPPRAAAGRRGSW